MEKIEVIYLLISVLLIGVSLGIKLGIYLEKKHLLD